MMQVDEAQIREWSNFEGYKLDKNGYSINVISLENEDVQVLEPICGNMAINENNVCFGNPSSDDGDEMMYYFSKTASVCCFNIVSSIVHCVYENLPLSTSTVNPSMVFIKKDGQQQNNQQLVVLSNGASVLQVVKCNSGGWILLQEHKLPSLDRSAKIINASISADNIVTVIVTTSEFKTYSLQFKLNDDRMSTNLVPQLLVQSERPPTAFFPSSDNNNIITLLVPGKQHRILDCDNSSGSTTSVKFDKEQQEDLPISRAGIGFHSDSRPPEQPEESPVPQSSSLHERFVTETNVTSTSYTRRLESTVTEAMHHHHPTTDSILGDLDEECDAIDRNASVTFYNIKDGNVKSTYSMDCSKFQLLCTDPKRNTFVVQRDIHGLVYKCSNKNENLSFTHEQTIGALGFVQASKQTKKFMQVSPTLFVIAETSRRVYIYDFKCKTQCPQFLIDVGTVDIVGLYISKQRIITVVTSDSKIHRVFVF